MKTQTRMGWMALTLALLAGVALRVEAADFVWKGATAAWNTDAQWNPAASAADYANAAKTFLVTNGTVQSVNGGTFTAQLTIQGNGQTNYSGGTFEVIGGHTATLSNWHLNGGRFYHSANANVTLNGALTVDSDSFWDIASGGKGLDFNASITGSGSLKAKIESMQFNLNAASSGYSGLWTILPGAGKLKTSALQCMGTGWVDIQSGGVLFLMNNVSNLTGSGIVVRAGGSLAVEGNATASIRMQGGLLGELDSSGSSYSLGGSIYLDAPSTFKTPGSNGKTLTINAALYGTNGITVTNFAGTTISEIVLGVDNSGTYTGAWNVVGCILNGNTANAFGVGTVTATNGTGVKVNGNMTVSTIYMKTGSTFTIMGPTYGTCTASNLYVDGATIQSASASVTLGGNIRVDGASTLRGKSADSGKVLAVSAQFWGSKPMILNNPAGYGRVQVSGNSGTSFSGGWMIQSGTLELMASLGLGNGLGPLTIAAAGPKLYYEAAYTVTNSVLTLGPDTFAAGTYSITNTYVSEQANSISFTNFFTRKAGVNDGWVVVRSLEPLPTITNAAPTNVTVSTAWLNGGLTSNGWAAASVSVGWDTTDRGANPTWASNTTWAAPQPSPTSYTYQATGLLPDKTYYYTYSASNANNKVGWATPSKSFITGGLTVQATDPLARTSAVDTATFTVSRPATCTNEDLQVYYTVGGTATNTDYALDKASGSVVISKGQTNGTIVLTPVWKVDVEKTVTLTLAAGPYAIGSPASAQCTLAAHEFDFVWEGGTANWRTGSAWNPDAVAGDFSDVSKVFLATNGTLQTANGESFAPLLILRGNGDTNAFVGATLAVGSGNTVTLDRWHLDGGRFTYNAGANATVNGALTVDSDSVWDITSDGKAMDFNASIAGSGGLKVKINNMGVNLKSAGSSYSGLWTILPSGRLNASAANCLGTGWVDILGGGSLGLYNNVSGLTGSGILVRAGASLSVEGDSIALIRMQGGMLGTLVSVNGAYSLGGSIYLDAPSTFKTPGSDGKWLTVNSTLYGTNGITVTNFAGAASAVLDLTVNNSGTYSGAWTVVGGQVKGSVANAFGAGTVTATTGALVSVVASQTVPVFYMGTGSTFYAAWGGTATMGGLHVAGATINCDNQNKTLAGAIYVDGPSTLYGYGSDAGRSFTISAPFYGSQRMTFSTNGAAPGPVYLSGDSRTTSFSGGWTIQAGTLTLQNALGLGGGLGPANIAAGALSIATGGKLGFNAAYALHVMGLTLGTTRIDGSPSGILYNVPDLPNYTTYFTGTTTGSTITVYDSFCGVVFRFR